MGNGIWLWNTILITSLSHAYINSRQQRYYFCLLTFIYWKKAVKMKYKFIFLLKRKWFSDSSHYTWPLRGTYQSVPLARNSHGDIRDQLSPKTNVLTCCVRFSTLTVAFCQTLQYNTKLRKWLLSTVTSRKKQS